jgi:hypothetical protein
MLADESKHDKHLKLNRPTHARHPSDLDDLFNGRHASPGEAMKYKHKMTVLLRLREQHHRQEQQRLQVLRARAASTSSTDSSVSLGSDDDYSIEDGAPAPDMPTGPQGDMQQSDSGLMQQEQEVVAA